MNKNSTEHHNYVKFMYLVAFDKRYGARAKNAALKFWARQLIDGRVEYV